MLPAYLMHYMQQQEQPYIPSAARANLCSTCLCAGAPSGNEIAALCWFCKTPYDRLYHFNAGSSAPHPHAPPEAFQPISKALRNRHPAPDSTFYDPPDTTPIPDELYPFNYRF